MFLIMLNTFIISIYVWWMSLVDWIQDTILVSIGKRTENAVGTGNLHVNFHSLRLLNDVIACEKGVKNCGFLNACSTTL